jgi:hypothetical protein
MPVPAAAAIKRTIPGPVSSVVPIPSGSMRNHIIRRKIRVAVKMRMADFSPHRGKIAIFSDRLVIRLKIRFA